MVEISAIDDPPMIEGKRPSCAPKRLAFLRNLSSHELYRFCSNPYQSATWIHFNFFIRRGADSIDDRFQTKSYQPADYPRCGFVAAALADHMISSLSTPFTPTWMDQNHLPVASCHNHPTLRQDLGGFYGR
jgi:hypothetical protein